MSRKRLRVYLILAILIVGLIPKPDMLFRERGECHTFYSAFLRVTLNYEDCAGGKRTEVIIITIPGFLDAQRKNIPTLVLYFAHPNISSGRIMTRKSTFVNFTLLPEFQIEWNDD